MPPALIEVARKRVVEGKRVELAVRFIIKKKTAPLKAPVCVKLPAPASVKAKLAPVMAGKLKEALVAVLMVVALLSVIVPLSTLAVEAVVAIAPAALTPVPATEIVLPLPKVAPFNNNSAPELMVIAPVPRPLLAALS